VRGAITSNLCTVLINQINLIMKTEEKFNLGDWLANKTVEFVVQMSKHQNIDFDKSLAVEYLTNNSKVRFKEIIDNVRKDQEESKESILFTGSAWQKKIFDTNLTHAILLFAKDVLNYAKYDKTLAIK